MTPTSRTPSTPRRGGWCQTFTGRMSWPCDPRADDICIRPWGWRQAEVRFHARYYELRGERSWRLRAIRANPALVWGFLLWFCHALVWGRRA